MPDTLPDRLSTDPRSPYYNAELLERDIGVRFKGVEKTNVAEYCVSERLDPRRGRQGQGPLTAIR